MFSWIIKILIFCACIELWYQGGQTGRAWCRDILIPIILGVYLGFKSVWFIGILSIGSFNIIRIGYGIPDETDEGSLLGRTFKIPWLVRGIAGLLYGLIGLINFVIYTKAFMLYIAYSLINFFIQALGEKLKLNIKICDRLTGAAVGCLVFIFF